MAPSPLPKILLLITKSNWGGAQAYTFALATQMRDKGYPVAVACGGTGQRGEGTGVLAQRLDNAGIRVHPLVSLIRDISLRDEWRAFREVCALLTQERPDVVHLNSSKAGVVGAVAAKLCGIRHIIFTAHGWPHRESRAFPIRCIIWLASWCTILLCDTVIVVSQKDFDTAPVFFSRKKLRLIHNGMSVFPLHPKQEARTALLAFAPHMPIEKRWFLMSAELTANKAIDTAIRAFHAASLPDSILVIMGEGQDRSMLESLILDLDLSHRVFLLGFVPEARSYLCAGDVLLLPSRKEGFPLALLEAGIASLPVIASCTGGIPELIQDGLTGLLIPPADQTALVSALERIASDEPYARQLGVALHDRVLTSFSESEMVERTIQVYGI